MIHQLPSGNPSDPAGSRLFVPCWQLPEPRQPSHPIPSQHTAGPHSQIPGAPARLPARASGDPTAPGGTSPHCCHYSLHRNSREFGELDKASGTASSDSTQTPHGDEGIFVKSLCTKENGIIVTRSSCPANGSVVTAAPSRDSAAEGREGLF